MHCGILLNVLISYSRAQSGSRVNFLWTWNSFWSRKFERSSRGTSCELTQFDIFSLLWFAVQSNKLRPVYRLQEKIISFQLGFQWIRLRRLPVRCSDKWDGCENIQQSWKIFVRSRKTPGGILGGTVVRCGGSLWATQYGSFALITSKYVQIL